jgi:hypothetical protein
MKKIYVDSDLFVSWVSYILVYLNSGFNLFQSIKQSVELVAEPLQEKLLELVELMTKDKSLGPFQNFAANFESELIHQIIAQFYQVNKIGKSDDQLEQVIPLVERLRQQVIESKVKNEQQVLNFYLIAPLVGTAIISLYFSTGILTLLIGNLYG